MSRPTPGRLAGIAIGVGLGLLLGGFWFLRARERARLPNTVVPERVDVQDRLLALRRAESEVAGEPLGLVPDSVLGREVVPERYAPMLYPGFNRYTVWDRHTVFAHAPDVRRRVRWPEHPRRGWTTRTNALGMRADGPPASPPPALRILVLGDSHTDGVCPNDETFAARLEALLAARLGASNVEVLNGGKGGWCAYNYLGAIEKWRDLEPDLVVVAFYGGNDLVEAPLYRDYFERNERPAAQRAMALRVAAAAGDSPEACSQVLTQTAYLSWTGALEATIETSVRVLDELARSCTLIGAEAWVAYLPAPTQVEPERHADRLASAMAALELERDDLAILDRARDGLLERLRSVGIRTLDLTPALERAARDERTYWEADLHLGLAGHRAVAEALRQAILASPLAPSPSRDPAQR